MNNGREVVVVSGVRTAIGDFGGSLKDFAPTELGARCVREALSRAKVAPDEVGHVVFGNVIHTEPKDMYMSRVCAMNGGIPKEVPAVTLNRLCGSGLQAIVSAAQIVALGDADVAVAGGVESMSRANYWLPSARWGSKMGDQVVMDSLIGALSDPFDTSHMGVTAENVAAKYGISREAQDEFSVESHRRAANAIKNGWFKSQILPIEIKDRKGTKIFDTDEHVRAETTMDSLGKLKPVFKKDGSVTPGNASGINDGAAAVVLMERKLAEKRGLKPMARLVAYGHAGVEPTLMGLGPIPAVQNAMKKAGLKVADMDVVESNEAFAAQACAVNREMDWDTSRINVNGGAIAIGHPIGASGCRVLVTLLHEMRRRGANKGLASLCIGGGMGVALAVERA